MIDRDLGEPSSPRIFDTFAPGVDSSVASFLSFAERSGALGLLDPERSELLIEYYTADVTLEEMGGYLGLTRQGVDVNIASSFRKMWRIMMLPDTNSVTRVAPIEEVRSAYWKARKHIGKTHIARSKIVR